MAVEGWPASHQRRMQLGSPRLKSLSDLVEEGSEQQVFSLKKKKKLCFLLIFFF
jgi:hypothetical protein